MPLPLIKQLLDRLIARENTAGGPFVKPVATAYIASTRVSGVAPTTLLMVTDRIVLYPFMPGRSFTMTDVALNVTTAAASSKAKVVIYSADTTTGRPSALLYESAELDTATTGAKETPAAVTLSAGVVYWVGMKVSGAPTYSGYPASAAENINGRTTVTTNANT